MAEFKLGRIRFVWKNDWATGTTYYKDDIVHYGGKTFLCVVGHTSAADFYTNLNNVPSKWNQFSDGQVWKGNWSASGTVYKIGDIVKYGGDVYICKTGHTSQATLEADQGKWDLFAAGFDWKGNWAINTTYKVNDVVKYGGYLYIANSAHTSAATLALGLEQNIGNWDLYSKGIDWKGDWAISTRYKLGDLVKYGGTTYVCSAAHTSAATLSLGLEQDQGNWNYFNQGIDYKGAWSGSTVRYKVNDVVKNGGGTWICVTNHTSTSNFVADQGNWNKFVEGVLYKVDWTATVTYQPGDFVRYGGNNYISKTAHIASGGSPPSTNTTDWSLFATGFKLAGDWATGGSGYRVGEVVRNNGFTYVAVADNVSQKPPNATYWAKLNEGIKWRNVWLTSTAYELGDAVKDGPNSYICILSHTSSTPSKPANDVGGTYWNLLTGGNEESVLTTTGDLVYYGGAGATRLPVGDTGQVLSVQNGLPAWTYFGKIAKVFYVGPNGVNSPAPTYGLTIDQPFASVRYAFEQIEAGYDRPQAAYLLKNNRNFIAKEILEYVTYQIANPTGIWVGFTNTSTTSCERDMGLIVDAVVYDITHGGNSKTIAATNTFFTALGALIPSYTDEYRQGAAAITYGLSVITSVLANTAPAASYQTLNGISAGNQIKQIIDTGYTAESGTTAVVTALISIVTNALTAQSNSAIPVLDTPNYTVFVKTGQFYEVAPLRLPANTSVVGDELRSTRISPAGQITASNDRAKSITALQRLQAITPNIITNTSVSPTSGNSATQVTTKQRAGTGTALTVQLSNSNITEMKKIINLGESYASAFVYPTPTSGTGNASDSGYLNAARLVLANKQFVKDEVTAYMNTNYSSIWSALSAGDKAKCTRDMGYIVDALVYDLTYGGNLQTVIVARSYYANGVLIEPTAQKTALLATVNRIQTFIDDICVASIAWYPRSTGNTTNQDVSGTPGSAGAGTFAQARVTEIYNTINTGTTPTTIAPSITWASATLQAAFNKMIAAKGYIQAETISMINTYFPELSYNATTCSRDVGYIIDALAYDYVFGSNYMSIKTAASYRRGITSTQVVITSQLVPTIQTIDFIYGQLQSQIRKSTATLSVRNNAREMRDILTNGTVAADAYVYPDPTSYGAGFSNARRLILSNKAFLQAEISAYVPFTYGTSISSIDGTGELFNTGTAHGLTAGAKVGFSSTQGGVTQGVTYYVLAAGLTTTAFKVASTSTSSTPVDLSTVASPSPAMKVFAYDAAKCARDIGYEVDALVYDLTYGETSGCNLATQIAARSYYSYGSFVEPSAEKTAALGVQTRIKAIITQIAQASAVTATAGNVTSQDVSGTAGSSTAGTFAQARVQEMYDTINTGTAPTTIAPSTAWVSASLVASRTALNAAKTEIQTHATDYVAVNFPTLVYNITTCQRDVGYMVDALGYDLMFGSNYLSIQNGLAYQRATTSAQYVVANQLAATTAIINFIGEKSQFVVASDPVQRADILWGNILRYITSGVRPIVTGNNSPTTDADIKNGAQILSLNTAFMQAEATAYIANTFKATVTAATASTDTFTCSTTAWMVVGDAVRFTGSVGGGVSLNTTYYISAIVDGLTFKLSSALNGAVFDVPTNFSGTMTVSYYYSAARCQNDVAQYINAVTTDMVYTGNYNSVMAARFYRNALTGSKLDDFYYVRNGCGVRNQTLTGLDGSSDGNTTGYQTALTTTINSYGTKRPRAGAYVSLDPGWGPSDSRVWVSSKSTYVQNVTTFGTGCVGQKIDGSLHAGGNDSIVSNDFTQVLSDGIGAWVTNLGRAELVSVFTYYNYIGYLAENGGKIRATNGNNSYGTYGSVAEFIDTSETPVTGFITNRLAGADVRNVLLSGDQIWAVEYGNAGSSYTSATYSFSGAGNFAAATANEFRDGAVFNVRTVDPGDSTGGGGYNYLTSSNTGQGGTALTVTLAAADQQNSTAYVGMMLNITGGTGAGQYGVILAYSNASKVATMVKDSFTTLTVTATAITTNLITVSGIDTLYYNMPIILDTAIGNLLANTPYYVMTVPAGANIPLATVSRSSATATIVTSVAHGLSTGQTISVYNTGTALDSDLNKVITVTNATTFTYTSGTTGTIGSTAATSAVITPDYKITVTSAPSGGSAFVLATATGTVGLYAAGMDHVVAGTPILSSLSVTTVYTITPRLSFTAPGYTKSTASLPSAVNWTDSVYGDAYGSYTSVSATGGSGSLATFDVVRRNGVYTVTPNIPGVLYVVGNTLTIAGTSLGGTSANNITVTVTGIVTGSSGVSTITYTGTPIAPKFVAISNGTTAGATSTDGVTWTAQTLPTTAATAVDYGVVANVGYWVIVATGSTAYYSTDGITWQSGGLGSTNNWSDVVYANGKFTAIAPINTVSAQRSVTSNGGGTWNNGALATGANAIAGSVFRFVTVQGAASGANSNSVSHSVDGTTWLTSTLPSVANWVDVTFGNGRFVAIADSSQEGKGKAAYSLDGITWYASYLPDNQQYTSIQYAQGLFHVLGANHYGATSPDGINWTTRNTSLTNVTVTSTAKDTTAATYTALTLPTNAYWQDVIWDGAKFIAVGHDNSAAAYGASSTDGITWSSVTLPLVSSTYSYSAIAYNGSTKYVALIADTRHIASSSDGTTWAGTINAIPTAGGWSDMIFAGGKFVAVSGAQNRTAYSTDGVTWLNGTISASASEYTSIAYGQPAATAYYVVVAGLTATSQYSAYSTDGVTWTAGTTMPSADLWSSVTYGGGKFVAVAGNATTATTKAAYSSNGTTWTSATLPSGRWTKVIYGGGAFTAYAYNNTATAYSTDGITWVAGANLPVARNWVAAAYGNNRNVVLPGFPYGATPGTIINAGAQLNFVLDTNYLTLTTPSSLLEVGQKIKFTPGTEIGGLTSAIYYYIVAVNGTTQFSVSLTKGGSKVVLSSATGTMTGAVSNNWLAQAFGNYNGTGIYVALPSNGGQKALTVSTGARALARAYVTGSGSTTIIGAIWIREPGSGYTVAPTMTITDPNNTGIDAPVTVRIGNGALGQPTFTNRGTGYASASSSIVGNGYADNYQLGNYIGFTGLTSIPVAGSNVQILGIDKIWYRLVTVTGLKLDSQTGLYSATLQISPKIGNAEAPEHLTPVTIRRRYSQVRLTGHDFLSIGTGNIVNTNYPGLPLQSATPSTETVNSGGGRVFYTSTDQDGNFRVGGLFNVEQATGVATLNADAFNIAGLNQLSLGSVALGGTGAVITEFSTDPYFTLNSDSVVPTQRAIKAYITSQIGGGGSQLNVNTLTAGVIYIAGQAISTTTSVQININTKVNFKGGIDGTALALNYFLLNN
jgi:hypothetical protein